MFKYKTRIAVFSLCSLEFIACMSSVIFFSYRYSYFAQSRLYIALSAAVGVAFMAALLTYLLVFHLSYVKRISDDLLKLFNDKKFSKFYQESKKFLKLKNRTLTSVHCVSLCFVGKIDDFDRLYKKNMCEFVHYYKIGLDILLGRVMDIATFQRCFINRKNSLETNIVMLNLNSMFSGYYNTIAVNHKLYAINEFFEILNLFILINAKRVMEDDWRIDKLKLIYLSKKLKYEYSRFDL